MNELYVLVMDGNNFDNTFLGVYSNLTTLLHAASGFASSDEFSDDISFAYKVVSPNAPAKHSNDGTTLKKRITFE